MLYSLLRSLKCRQVGQTQMNISVDGSSAVPAASGPDAAFIDSITDNGIGSWTIVLKESAKLAPFVSGLVCITAGRFLKVTASTVNSITVTAASSVDVAAYFAKQDITYTARAAGVGGNSITVAYTAGAVAGAEVVTVVGNAISIQISTGVSTATQVLAAFNASSAALALAYGVITGTAGTAQVTDAADNLANGAAGAPADADFNIQWQYMDQLNYYF